MTGNCKNIKITLSAIFLGEDRITTYDDILLMLFSMVHSFPPL